MTISRVRVILTAAVTWLVALGAVLVIVVDELGGVAGIPPAVVKVLGTVLTAAGVAAAIIRRVSPVLPEARGLVDNGKPKTHLEFIGASALRSARKRSHPANELVEQYPGEFA